MEFVRGTDLGKCSQSTTLYQKKSFRLERKSFKNLKSFRMLRQDFTGKNDNREDWFWEKVEFKQDHKETTALKIDDDESVPGTVTRDGNTNPGWW